MYNVTASSMQTVQTFCIKSRFYLLRYTLSWQ